MRRFLGMLGFELRFYLRRISTWAYFGIFFALGFFIINAAGGAWDSIGVGVGGSGGNVRVNSPYVLAVLIASMSLFGVLVTAALLGNAVHRDYEAGVHPLFFASPVSKRAYLGSRFVGALLVNALILFGLPLGVLVGSLMPYLDAERFGPVRLEAYLQPFLTFVLPNLLFTGAIFFALAAITRQMLPNYVGGAVLLIGYLLGRHLAEDVENREIAGLLDPFGMTALSDVTKYWTAAQKNALTVGFEGAVLENRLLWVAVGLAVFAGVYLRFRFSHEAGGGKRRARAGAAPAPAAAFARPRSLTIPAARRSFSMAAHLQQYLSVVRRSFWGVVGNRYFLAILAAGLMFLVVGAGEVGKMYGTTTWPVTYAVLDMLGGMFALFVLIIVTFYAGELVWRERDARLNQVWDATPTPNWVPFLGKLTALVLVVAVLQGVILVAGVATQAAKGYHNFELGLYARVLFGFQLADYALLCALVMLVHIVANHKYMGHLIAILYFVFAMFAGQLGVEHHLLLYGADSGLVYSDMNGFGPFLVPNLWFKAYWAAWALLFALASNLFWVRGQETGAQWRVRLARLRFGRPAIAGVALAAVLVASLGGFVFYNTNVLNDYRTTHQKEQLRAEYERLYKRYEGVAQPRIAGADLRVEIYPEQRDATVAGTFRLVNRTAHPIDSLHVLVQPDLDVRALGFDREAQPVLVDPEHGYRIYRLARALQPRDSLRMEFSIALETRGFGNEVGNLQLVGNGTFFNSGALPTLGYSAHGELSDEDTRRKHGLEPRERMLPIDDPRGLANSYISQDADRIDFRATIGTSADQIAIAPGYLSREWSEGERRYYEYRMDAPILNFYSFLSARYQVRRDRWNDVAIEVYHHPGHAYNLDRMVEATRKSLEYFSREFGPYQHRQVRILEFPRYSAFAQSFPNTIPYSEAIGFIARVDEEDDIDYPFYVTAHEVAHQWWGHQVVGANVQGSTVLVETLAQYGALMVMEAEYGREQIGRFLKYELDRYLTGRAMERQREMPLLYNENQGYIHYRKGAVAMYALRDYIGEERLNAALAAFVRDHKFGGPPYPTSRDLYAYLEEATPDSLDYVLADLFEHITLWDLRATRASSERTPDGAYRVTIDLEAHKTRADSLGNEVETSMDDLIDVGVFGPAPAGENTGKLLYLQKHRIRPGEQSVTVLVPEKPARAGIDPRHKLIDRHTDDNTVAVAEGRGDVDRQAGSR